MKNSDIADPIFREAVDAIDAGNLILLQHLVNIDPLLVGKRLDLPTQGYFCRPYLLWFVADNPIRHEKLPANIVQVTHLLIQAIKLNATESLQEQITCTLGLVATGRIPRESGLQIELMDLLIDEGAIAGNGHSALAHGNTNAARRLIERGGTLTLTAAVCLDRTKDIKQLASKANDKELQLALVAAAFYGKADMIKFLIEHNVNVNTCPDTSSGFHSHATALHQAVSAGSLESVKMLVEAGADLTAKDHIYQGSALDWAKYMQSETADKMMHKKYAAIEKYLLGRSLNK